MNLLREYQTVRGLCCNNKELAHHWLMSSLYVIPHILRYFLVTNQASPRWNVVFCASVPVSLNIGPHPDVGLSVEARCLCLGSIDVQVVSHSLRSGTPLYLSLSLPYAAPLSFLLFFLCVRIVVHSIFHSIWYCSSSSLTRIESYWNVCIDGQSAWLVF